MGRMLSIHQRLKIVKQGENPGRIPPYIGGNECEMDIRRNAVPDTPLHIHQSSSRMERIQELDEARMCIICFNNEKCVLFFPCLHVGVCV